MLAPITMAAQESAPAESVTNTQLPFADPQFWFVTLAALCAGAWLLRRVLPSSLFSRHRTRSSTRATLTVGGEPVEVKRQPERKCH